MQTSNKKRNTVFPLLVLAIGIILMIGKIYADSEPGAIPLALVLIGSGWYVAARVRTRRK